MVVVNRRMRQVAAVVGRLSTIVESYSTLRERSNEIVM